MDAKENIYDSFIKYTCRSTADELEEIEKINKNTLPKAKQGTNKIIDFMINLADMAKLIKQGKSVGIIELCKFHSLSMYGDRVVEHLKRNFPLSKFVYKCDVRGYIEVQMNENDIKQYIKNFNPNFMAQLDRLYK